MDHFVSEKLVHSWPRTCIMWSSNANYQNAAEACFIVKRGGMLSYYQKESSVYMHLARFVRCTGTISINLICFCISDHSVNNPALMSTLTKLATADYQDAIVFINLASKRGANPAKENQIISCHQ